MNIEEIIRENRHRFEVDELPENYLANFENRLKKPRRNLHLSLAISLLTAAMVALVLVLRTPVEPTMEINPEVAQMRDYYQGQLEQTKRIIEKLLAKVDIQTQAEIRSELAIMEQQDKEFIEQLSTKLPTEQYIAYQVEHYRTRQQNLEYIKNILLR